MADSNPPVIIIRKKKTHPAHHGGAWKVAYADFVTAMMALFIVLWLMTANQEIQKAIAGYFRDPAGSATKSGTSVGGVGETLTVTKDNMNLLKKKLERALLKNPDLSKLKNYVQITITPDGLRIELLENEKGVFFDNGDAQPTESGRKLLILIADQLGQLKNKILIEGHTDATPYQGKLYSNWELSADRANAARRIMQDHGLRADQVSQVRGYADQQLRLPDHPYDPSNRRISIIVQYSQKKAPIQLKTDAGTLIQPSTNSSPNSSQTPSTSDRKAAAHRP